jgi:hypothetical protein
LSKEEFLESCKAQALKMLSNGKTFDQILCYLFTALSENETTKTFHKLGQMFVLMNQRDIISSEGQMKKYIQDLAFETNVRQF